MRPTQAEQAGIAVERFLIGGNRKLPNLGRTENRVVGQSGIDPASNDLQRLAERNDSQNLDRFRQRRPANNLARFDDLVRHGGPASCVMVVG